MYFSIFRKKIPDKKRVNLPTVVLTLRGMCLVVVVVGAALGGSVGGVGGAVGGAAVVLGNIQGSVFCAGTQVSGFPRLERKDFHASLVTIQTVSKILYRKTSRENLNKKRKLSLSLSLLNPEDQQPEERSQNQRLKKIVFRQNFDHNFNSNISFRTPPPFPTPPALHNAYPHLYSPSLFSLYMGDCRLYTEFLKLLTRCLVNFKHVTRKRRVAVKYCTPQHHLA